MNQICQRIKSVNESNELMNVYMNQMKLPFPLNFENKTC
jgi:hypothetical protein